VLFPLPKDTVRFAVLLPVFNVTFALSEAPVTVASDAAGEPTVAVTVPAVTTAVPKVNAPPVVIPATVLGTDTVAPLANADAKGCEITNAVALVMLVIVGVGTVIEVTVAVVACENVNDVASIIVAINVPAGIPVPDTGSPTLNPAVDAIVAAVLLAFPAIVAVLIPAPVTGSPTNNPAVGAVMVVALTKEVLVVRMAVNGILVPEIASVATNPVVLETVAAVPAVVVMDMVFTLLL